MTYQLNPIGHVESPLTDRARAPKQGREGAPDAWLVFRPEMATGLGDLSVGADIIVLTWLHQADRNVLSVHPRDNPKNRLTGVFGTRSADRPNPIGLHRVRIVAMQIPTTETTAHPGFLTGRPRIRVSDLEAVDGTPIVDVKPALSDR
ncbi:tRNA (N6-threonylcarbamoyladenosine(37)-N6)-methyltransferase TrmO [Actinophytocola sp.]|uniref:tRNA (N6-threonylcarbamoyladenosine(37)-N6)-methyltransferase TrmO n=1 Tax=Actinophytocola sp. TaxID=1872138 RepID=UPI00389A5D7E